MQELMSMSKEERRAAFRGLRDAAPAVAPLPLPWTLAGHAVWILAASEVERRGGRWYHYAIAAPALAGFGVLFIKAGQHFGAARARSAGIHTVGEAPRVPRERTTLWLGLMVPVALLRRLAGRPARRRTAYEMGAATLARALVEWWAWRPYLSGRRRPGRAAPPA
jgi:hypothetical protein